MRKKKEKGVALIMALILVAVLTVMAASLLFVSQTETWSSMNYRMMSQARYGAESGVNTAANYLMSNAYAANAPGSPGDPITNYDITKRPVQFNGQDVVLSANTSMASNYPLDVVRTAFKASGAGSVTANNSTIRYRPYARLLSMRQLPTYPSGTLTVFQTWEITADGNIPSVKNSQVEVSAILERPVVPTFAYAAFATNNVCSSLSFGGGGSTDSYDSTAITYDSSGGVITQASDGDVGTNGNLDASGSTTVINGSLSTPRAGVGTCSTSGVTALSLNGNATVTGGLRELPQPVDYPTPPAPSPMPPTTSMNIQKKADCTGIPDCTASGSDTVITGGPSNNPTLLGNVTLNSGATLHLSAPTGTSASTPVYININSIVVNGNANIVIDPIPGTTPPQYPQIIINVAGVGQTTPIDLTGSSLTNPTLDPATFQILYGGTGQVILNGGSAAAGLVYAPNASLKLTGGGNWYGAVIGKQITDFGGAAIHYDRHLKKELWLAGPYMLSAFNWKKF